MIALIAGATLGLASWIHCIGMCGPLATVMVPQGSNRSQMVLRASQYHAGRTLMYCILGLLIGSVADAARIVVLGSAVSFLTGTTMIAAGCVQIAGGAPHVPGSITNRVRRLTTYLRDWSSTLSPARRSVLNGMINGMLPCGVSLSAVIAAATLSSIGERMLFLAAFGVMTSPALAGLAILIDRLSGMWKQRLRVISAVAMVLIGVLVTMRGLSLDIPYVSPKIADQSHIHHGCCQSVSE